MGCCCRKDPIPFSQRRCCICNPFRNDGYILISQICSIVAACLSWLWWPTFLLAIAIMINLQVIWCCKMRKRGLLATALLSFLAFVSALFTGIYMLVACWDTLFVLINRRALTSEPEDYDYNYSDTPYWLYRDDWCTYHNAVAWSIVAFLDAALYLIICISLYRFVRIRYDDAMAKLEEECCNDTDNKTWRGTIPSASVVGTAITDVEANNLPTTAHLVEMSTVDGGVDKVEKV
mmetsp:Transcript_22842/g.32177  ORF Transcript_22842/g.32177 Transcript_22842/m.32177 type:complete len:234 (-) Transcript_22842:88-789(-)